MSEHIDAIITESSTTFEELKDFIKQHLYNLTLSDVYYIQEEITKLTDEFEEWLDSLPYVEGSEDES